MLLIPYVLVCALVLWLYRRKRRQALVGYILTIIAIGIGIPVFWIVFGTLGIFLFAGVAVVAIVYEPRGRARQGWDDPGVIPGGAVRPGRGARLRGDS
jgi:cbb3-type cytochrome oxidase subunit 3